MGSNNVTGTKVTAIGLTVLTAAPAVLLVTGRTQVEVSADEEAGSVPLVGVVAPVLAGLLLTRLVPLRLPAMECAAATERPMLRRQVTGLAVLAAVFPLVVLILETVRDGELLYGPVKVPMLLGGAWLVLHREPGPSPARAHRERLPRRWCWLGPVPLRSYSPSMAGSGCSWATYGLATATYGH